MINNEIFSDVDANEDGQTNKKRNSNSRHLDPPQSPISVRDGHMSERSGKRAAFNQADSS